MLAPRYGPCLGGVRARREQRTPLGAAVRDEAAGGERAARGSPTLGARAPLRPGAVFVRDRGVRLAPLRARPAEHARAAGVEVAGDRPAGGRARVRGDGVPP